MPHQQFFKNMERNTDQADALFADVQKQFELIRRIWNRMDSHRFEEMVLNLHKKLDEMERVVRDQLNSQISDETDCSGSESEPLKKVQ